MKEFFYVSGLCHWDNALWSHLGKSTRILSCLWNVEKIRQHWQTKVLDTSAPLPLPFRGYCILETAKGGVQECACVYCKNHMRGHNYGNVVCFRENVFKREVPRFLWVLVCARDKLIDVQYKGKNSVHRVVDVAPPWLVFPEKSYSLFAGRWCGALPFRGIDLRVFRNKLFVCWIN